MLVYEGDPQRVASLLPGRDYTPNSPLLHYTRRALRDQGWTVREHWWSRGNAMPLEPAIDEAAAFVGGAGHPLLHLVVGKSLGSVAAPVAVDGSLPAIWFTPLLREPVVRAAIDRTLEPTLLVAGERDEAWDAEAARASRCQVHQIDGADHLLEIPGSLRDTLKAAESVMRRVDDFIRGLEH